MKGMVAIFSDKQLDFEKTLADYNIQNEAVIYFWDKSKVASEHVFVEEDPGDKFFAFNFDGSNTISDIKKMVEEKTGW